ncbi:MAG: PorT family protein [Bacteroidetes bacterium]|nr:PorT family protein [Bacteroidota bacterium]
MKLRLFTVAAALIIVSMAHAQISVGVEVGPNFASQSSDADGFEAGSTTGFYFGIPVDIMLSDNICIQPSLAFMQKGSSSEYEFSVPNFYETSVEADFKLNYLEIPILVNYLIGSGNIRPVIGVGPSIGFGMGYKSSGTSTTDDIDDSGSFEDAGLSGIDFSVLIQAGVLMSDVGPGSLGLNLGYMLGLANINDGGANTLNNRGVKVALMYKFPIGG